MFRLQYPVSKAEIANVHGKGSDWHIWTGRMKSPQLASQRHCDDHDARAQGIAKYLACCAFSVTLRADRTGWWVEGRQGDPTRSALHLGYLFSERAWGKGYGSELIGGLVFWLQHQGLPLQLTAGVGRDNPASARALVKKGFVLEATASNTDTDTYVLRI